MCADVDQGNLYVCADVDQGSVYVCGYPIEKRESDGVWSHQLRCVHDGKVSGRKAWLSAGLHYLLALDDDTGSSGGVAWGKCILPTTTTDLFHRGSRVSGHGRTCPVRWEKQHVVIGRLTLSSPHFT